MSRLATLSPGQWGVAAILGLVYVGASAWLIHGEGESYRNTLLASRTAIDPPAEAAPGPEPVHPEPVQPEPPAPKPPEPVEPPPAPPEDTRPTPAPVVARPADPPPAPILDPFWELPAQKTVWDLDHLTIEDERRLGAALHEMILHDHKPLVVGPLPARVEAAAEPFLDALSRKDLKYTFTVLDCGESNTFSFPGGYIYVCRGIFDWITEDEDYALGFLLGHEMAHVDLKHAVNCLRDPEVKKLDSGTVPLFYSLLIPWGYKPEQDLDADRWAWMAMTRDGHSRREILAYLRKLEDFAKKNGFENVRKRPFEDKDIAPIDNHLRAHPIPRERLKALEKLMNPVTKGG
ncbi:M48 family metalloprotease [Tundrisphaera lichenicola]|uniref:M48 family metalloprotease n=1 Tax=Tundrisphaera lichenicola TaxID=2029860 RepID=UPI003EBB1AE6